MEPTSFSAYLNLVEAGKLSIQQRQVLLTLFRFGPLTAREIEAKLDSRDHHKRFASLEAKSLIRSDGSVVCSVTGKKAKVWTITKRGKQFQFPKRDPNLSTDPQDLPRRSGVKNVLDTKKGPTVFAAILDGVVLRTATKIESLMEFCKANGTPLWQLRPVRVYEFEVPGTAGEIFADRALFDPKPRIVDMETTEVQASCD